MGRYYEGMIEGKFMFGVQSSNAADRFGSTYTEPNYVDYYFNEEHLPTINEELESLEESFKKVEKFFEDKDSWTSQQQEDAGIKKQEMSDYADYRLGVQIRDCILDQGYCEFEAEL